MLIAPAGGGSALARFRMNAGVNLYYAGANRLLTRADGVRTYGTLEAANLNVTGVTTAITVDVNGDLDVDGHTNLDNVSIAGVTTTTGSVNVGGYVVSQGTSGKGGIFGQVEVGYDSTYLTIQPTSGHNDLHLNFDNGSTVQIGHSSPTTLTVNGNIVPKTDSARDLGLTGTRFRNVYADTLYGSGANITGIVNASISASAAIAGSKISPNFGTQTLNAGLGYFSNHLSTQGVLTLSGGSVDINLNRASHSPNYKMRLTGGSFTTMNFRIQDSTNTEDRFIIRHGGQIEIPGDVGIGHPTNYSTTNISKVGSQTTLHIKGPSGQGAAIRLQDNGDTADTDDFAIYKNSTAAYLKSFGGDPIIVHQSGSERLRIDTNGNTLIGGIRTTNTGFGNKVLISGGTLGLDGNGSNIGMHFHRNSGDTEGYIGIGPWAVTGGTDNDFGFAAKGDLLFGTSSSTWAQKMRVADNGRVKIGTGAPKAQLDIKQQGNDWEDALLIQHDNANTGWNIHAERTNSALWFGYNSNTAAALTDQSASQVLHLNSNRTISTVISNNSYELTIGGISGGPTLWLRDSGTTGAPRILFGSTAGALIGAISYNNPNDYMSFYTNGTEHTRIDTSGHFKPVSDATRDLGTSSTRWRNVYTTDLQLSNENTGGNEVDGTEGNWTLQEGESDIYMINRKTGKKYKMMLQEVN